jgi:hypothetical protein
MWVAGEGFRLGATAWLTALQVEQAGTDKPKSLGPGKHDDDHTLYIGVRNTEDAQASATGENQDTQSRAPPRRAF